MAELKTKKNQRSVDEFIAGVDEKRRADCLTLVDLNNPDISGREFFQELASRMPDMIARVIFITGDAASPNAKEFLEGAGRPVIENPFELRVLQRQVAKALI